MQGFYLSPKDARDFNEMRRQVLQHSNTKVQPRRKVIIDEGGSSSDIPESYRTKIVSVQGASTGDGIYWCVPLIINKDNWTDETGKDKLELDGPTQWVSDYNYVVDNITWNIDSFYACIEDHKSITGQPPANNSKWVKVWPWGYATDAWSDIIPYTVCNRVIYSGKHYHCIQNNTGLQPDLYPTYWQETYTTDNHDYVYRLLSGAYHFFKLTLTHVPAADKQPPNDTYWESLFTFEVLNLAESNITDLPASPLVEGDRMTVFKFIDDTGATKYAGMPLNPESQAITIFEVKSAAVGNGIYNCCEQELIAGGWTDIYGSNKFDDKNTDIIEVFNLLENDPIDDYSFYTPMLGLYDKIAAWQIVDNVGDSRWVGIPLVNSVRQVKATEDSGASTHITCNLILNDGSEATIDQLGYQIEVYARICNETNLNAVVPRIASGDYLSAHNEQGRWWFETTFNSSEDCDCYTAP